jgi:uncharacterized protein (TIGR03083 family)
MEILELYLAGTRAVREALADPAVVAAWDEPSVLEEQTVGSLAGHLARTGAWILDEFLSAGEPDGPVDFDDVATFYVTLLPTQDDPIHQGIRDRGAALAAQGAATLAATVDERMPGIEAALRTLPEDHELTVTGGNVMTLGQYLVTRVVEQVVHLDDLARSVGREPWPLPEEALRLVAEIGLDIARLRHGSDAVVRALFRQGFAAEVLPAI